MKGGKERDDGREAEGGRELKREKGEGKEGVEEREKGEGREGGGSR